MKIFLVSVHMHFKQLVSVSLLALFSTLVSAKDYSTSDKDDFMFRLYAGADIATLNGQYKYVDRGFQIGFSNYLSLGAYTPYYLQVGFEYNQIHDETYFVEEKLCNFAIPVNICCISKPKNGLRFEAFVGGNFRINTAANITTKEEGYHVFSGLKTSDVRPLQVGMNVGGAFHVSWFVFSYRYNPDFTDFFDERSSRRSGGKTEYHFVTLGVNF